MLIGDWRRPLLHRLHSGFTRPQKSGPTRNTANFTVSTKQVNLTTQSTLLYIVAKITCDLARTRVQEFSHEYIVDPTQVEFRLLHINVHESSGPGKLPSWLLRDLAPLLSQPSAAIFNASLGEGYLPLIWKSAEVVPVPKVHPPTSICNDIRPISLLPTIAKVFESIVGKWFLFSIEPHLDNCQFG